MTTLLARLLGRGRRTLAVASLLLVASGAAADQDRGIALIGVNMAGAEFAPHVLPGKLGRDYHFPERRHFQYYQEKNVRLIRFPFKWERVQRNLGDRLHFDYVRQIKKTLDLAAQHDLKVILDMHNYARYRGELIGSRHVPYESYAQVWRLLAETFGGHPALYGYDIMNEPHSTAGLWPGAAQAAVDAIREVDSETLIFIEGDRWASAWHWPMINGNLNIKDPADRLVYEAHVYFDKDFSGRYQEPEQVDPMLGVNRVKPFVDWLKENGHRGFIGEYGVPDDSLPMLVAMDNMLAYLNEHCIPSAYWAAGPGWGDYKMAIEPRKGQDRPQMDILQKHIDNDCSEIGPSTQE
ncbi:glycoside hydrolase family 5 protein [Stutzerimonas tarimensis]|uniref:Glycoside hydrolase family 5 protein n=1 Tax=Stutzerimonas tarimensis TaxID=1507735 RepID=A0ABV7T2Y5_9GAMM